MLLVNRYPLLFFVVILFVNATTSDGDVWIDNGGMHIEDEGQYTINQEISYVVHVDYFSKPDTGTRVDLLEQGILRKGLTANGNSEIYISGGTVQEEVSAWDNSQMILEKGAVGWDLWGRHQSRVKVMGGTIGRNLVSSDLAQIDYIGGKIEGNLIAYWYSNITIYGTDFNYPLGKLSVPTGHITGILLDGTSIDNDFEILGVASWYNASITLVPEPCTISLLALGGLAVRKRRKLSK